MYDEQRNRYISKIHVTCATWSECGGNRTREEVRRVSLIVIIKVTSLVGVSFIVIIKQGNTCRSLIAAALSPPAGALASPPRQAQLIVFHFLLFLFLFFFCFVLSPLCLLAVEPPYLAFQHAPCTHHLSQFTHQLPIASSPFVKYYALQ